MEENISFGIAFVAGLLSFLSPCVLPLVPIYISFLSGVSIEELKREDKKKDVFVKSVISSIFFVLGFSFVFVALGASASFIGQFFTEYRDVLVKAAGVIIIFFGLYLVGILRIDFLGRQKKLQVKNPKQSYAGAFIMGFAFGFGWTPCIGPILAGILAIASTKETLIEGSALLLVYSLGLGIPFILTAMGIGFFIKYFEKYKKIIRYVEMLAGVLLILAGILIFSDNLSIVLQYIPETFYKFSK